MHLYFTLVFAFLGAAESADNATRVTLVLVRHSESCSNMLKWHGESKEWTEKDGDYADPLLSDVGLADARSLASQAAAVKPDFVGCSRLMRTMETAHGLFPDRDIHVWPHLDEMEESRVHRAHNVEDLPLPTAEQEKMLSQHYGSTDWLKRDRQWEDAGYISLELFLKQVVATLPPRPELKLAVVTHSDLMRWDALLTKWMIFPLLPWAHNVQGFEVTFDVTSSKVSRVGNYRALWEGFYRKHEALDCSQVARCDAEYMKHVRDGEGKPCGQTVDDTFVV